MTRNVRDLNGNFDRSPVFGKGLLAESRNDQRLTSLERVSHAFISSGDTFVITLVDMNKSGSYDNPGDIVVISSLLDSLAPIIPAASSNSAFYRRGLQFDYYGNYYQLINISSDGKAVTIRRLPSNIDHNIPVILTDKVSTKLSVSDLQMIHSYNLLETLQAKGNEYALVYFWLPSCAKCFENIPTLQKFEKRGITLINLFHIENDELALVEKQILRYEIPGMNFRSNPELMKYFSQNGFPHSILINVHANKIYSTHQVIEEHEKYITF